MNIDITISIGEGDETISLSEEEARALYERLKKLFGDNDPPTYVPVWINPWPQAPTTPSIPWYTGTNTGDPPPEMPYTISNTFTVTPGTSGIGEVTTN